jgi:COMPASS component BRE2
MQSFGTGDVIGLHISLPKSIKSENSDSEEHKKGVFRDRIPIRFKGQLYFEQPDYAPSKEMEELMNPVLPPQSQNNPSIPVSKPSFPTIKDSFINVYKNGEFMGTAFEELLDFLPPASQLAGRDLDDGMLGYYPAVSVFRYGIVRLNFGPEWLCPPKDLEGRGIRPMCERYDEILREEKEWDLIDEMEWEKDAARMEPQVGAPVTTGAEIKELTDEWT